jgi:hypothetical protein
MIEQNKMPTQARLRELFLYDPETGIFTRISKVKGAKLGTQAGHIKDNGYIHFSVDRKKHGAHRLAWVYMYGVEPPEDIDHIDGNRANNAIKNLRCVNRSTNLQNIKKPKGNNKSTGVLGAYKLPYGRFTSKIRVENKSINLGCFDTAIEAHTAYINAKQKYHIGYVK